MFLDERMPYRRHVSRDGLVYYPTDTPRVWSGHPHILSSVSLGLRNGEACSKNSCPLGGRQVPLGIRYAIACRYDAFRCAELLGP